MRNNILYLLFLSMSFVSCSLDERSIDFTLKDDFYKSNDDLLMSVNSCYNTLSNETYYGNQFTSAIFCSADYGEGNTGQNSVQQFTRGELTGEHIILKKIWAQIYKGIARTNSVIYYSDKAENVNLALKARVIGEAKFIRALNYFNLVQCFGEVPLRLLPVLNFDKEEKLGLASKQSILEQIVSDLVYAETNCWNRGEIREGFVNEVGRVTSLAATTLLAKVYLYMASVGRIANDPNFKDGTFSRIHKDFAGYSNYNDNYTLCKETCERGIKHPDFAMEKDWANLWNVTTNKNPKEYIFAIQYSNETGYGNRLPFLFLPRQSVLGGSRSSQGGVNRFVSEFVNLRTLDADNDYRWNNGFIINLDFRDGAKSEDWRWNTAGKGFYFITGTNTQGKGGGKNKLSLKKWNDSATTSEASSSCDLPILRSIDLYLMLSECKAELSQNPADGYDDINMARQRLNASTVDDTYLSSFEGDTRIEKFRNLILRERLQEFAGEGDRYFTLLRMGKYISECNKVVAKGNGAKVRTLDNYYWPISQDEVAANLSNAE